jgi:hypothetical protein
MFLAVKSGRHSGDDFPVYIVGVKKFGDGLPDLRRPAS